MALIFFHNRIDGKLFKKVDRAEARKLQRVRASPSLIKRLSAKDKAYVENIRQIALGIDSGDAPFVPAAIPGAEVYDDRYR